MKINDPTHDLNLKQWALYDWYENSVFVFQLIIV